MNRPFPFERRARRGLLLVLAALIPLASCSDDDAGAPAPLAWADCAADAAPAPFLCATLAAPLDHRRPGAQEVQLAVVKHPASDPARRLGAIFFNPGGPGGKGTDDLPAWIDKFPAALRERFDLISWDPRGIGRSTAVRCFDSAADEEAFKARMAIGFPVGDAAVDEQARLQAEFNQGCAARAGDLLAHVSTADTARDLEWLRRAAGEPSLNYIGVSYGTLLGATYANLFPQQVRAMVLDGNVDPPNYFADVPLQGTSVRIRNDIGTAETLAEFLRLCAAAGTPRCAFARGDAASTIAKLEELASRLAARPVVLPSNPGVQITEPAMLSIVGGWLFTVEPIDNFPGWSRLAVVLQALWEASEVALAAPAAPANPATPQAASQAAAVADYDSDGAGNAVQCSESPNPRDGRLFVQVAAFAAARAGRVGQVVAWFDAPCASWPGRAAAVHAGPWNQPTAPILVIGNTFDPATAYVSSQAMAGLLANARLLTVDGYGHTVLLNSSRCASDLQAAYFIDGSLPAEGTRCRQDRQPFAD